MRIEIQRARLNVEVLLVGLDFDVAARAGYAFNVTSMDVTYTNEDDGTMVVVQAEGRGYRRLKAGGLGSQFIRNWLEWAVVPKEVRDAADAVALALIERVKAA